MSSIYVNDITGSPKYTITNLENGTSYDFSVFGINMLGAGPSVDISVVPSTVTDAPEVSITHSDRALHLQWSDPDDEGNAISGYNVYRSRDDSCFHLLAGVEGIATSYDDENLCNGTTYYYKVTAVNDNGEGLMPSVISEYPSSHQITSRQIVKQQRCNCRRKAIDRIMVSTSSQCT